MLRVNPKTEDDAEQSLLDSGYKSLYGMNVTKINYCFAAPLIHEAAEAKIPHARALLGSCYSLGMGVPVNEARAVELWQSEPESMYAQKELAWCYKFGNYGFDKNSQTYMEKISGALPALQSAAAQGVVHAQFHLAYCYHWALGVKTDNDAAEKWYEAAANQGHADAQVQYSSLTFFKNPDRAIAALEKAAEQNCCEGQFMLGIHYKRGKDKQGKGVDKDLVKARRLLVMARENGYGPAAQFKIDEIDKELSETSKLEANKLETSKLEASKLKANKLIESTESKSQTQDTTEQQHHSPRSKCLIM